MLIQYSAFLLIIIKKRPSTRREEWKDDFDSWRSGLRISILELIIIKRMKQQHDEIDKKFLFKENRKLRMELKEANEFNALHKDAIYKLSQPHIDSHVVISVLIDLLAATKNSKKVESVLCAGGYYERRNIRIGKQTYGAGEDRRTNRQWWKRNLSSTCARFQ